MSCRRRCSVSCLLHLLGIQSGFIGRPTRSLVTKLLLSPGTVHNVRSVISFVEESLTSIKNKKLTATDAFLLMGGKFLPDYVVFLFERRYNLQNRCREKPEISKKRCMMTLYRFVLPEIFKLTACIYSRLVITHYSSEAVMHRSG
jgi:hypothetical protein